MELLWQANKENEKKGFNKLHYMWIHIYITEKNNDKCFPLWQTYIQIDV